MKWKRFSQWLDSLDGDEVAVTPLLEDFPGFPEKRLKGYVKPSGEPTVAVSHLKTVAERYGDGDGHGGPSEASDGDGLQLKHNTTVPDDSGSGSDVENEGRYQTIRETIKEINAIHEGDTAE